MLGALTIVFVIITRTASQPCQYENSVELEDGEYNVDNSTQPERECICTKKLCIRKCCPLGQGYNEIPSVRDCAPRKQKFNFSVYEYSNLLEPIKGFDAAEKFHFLYGRTKCSEEKGETRFIMEDVRLLTDGNLYVSFSSNVPEFIIYGPDKYCIDTFFSDGAEPHLNALICFVEKPDDNHYGLSSTCMLISCFFILLTVAVYAWLPELRNLHGMVLMAYLLCFFVGFLCLASMQILILRKEITEQICLVLTFIIYFFLLAAFFWLNVMCYDIWWTFSGKRAHAHSGSQNKRFMFYAIYAFSVPTVLTIILASLEFAELSVDHPLLPNLRLQGCFLFGNSKLLYLYGPIVILCVANMTFFSLTAFKIWKIKKETKMLRGKESSTHDQDRKDTQRFTLYVKLFTVMGINWILEVVSSFYPSANFFWQFSDAYNVLVGLIIFIIFVCKNKTWNMIKKRFRQMRGKSLSRTQTTISTTNPSHSTSRDELQLNSIRK